MHAFQIRAIAWCASTTHSFGPASCRMISPVYCCGWAQISSRRAGLHTWRWKRLKGY